MSTKGDSEHPSGWWRSGGWRAGAVTAIIAGAVGSFAPLLTTWWGYQHDTDMANRRLQEQAYAECLEETKRLEYGIRFKLKQGDGPVPTLADVSASVEPVRLYGEREASTAANDMVQKLIEAAGTGREADWEAYDTARGQFIEEVRDSLGVSQ